MRLKIQAAALVALVFPAALAAAQPPADEPVCRASLDGQHLTTVVRFEDGYTVEGPWQVLENHAASLSDGSKGIRVGARLGGIVEVNPTTGARESTPFDHPVDVTFEGRDRNDLMDRAARIWCASVSKARSEHEETTPKSTPARPALSGVRSA